MSWSAFAWAWIPLMTWLSEPRVVQPQRQVISISIVDHPRVEGAAAPPVMAIRASARAAGRASIGEWPPGRATLSMLRRFRAVQTDHSGLTARSSWQWIEATGTSGQRGNGPQPSQSAVCWRRSLVNAHAA